MARLPRFFLPGLVVGDVTLEGTEAHHLLNVRRLSKGDAVELFNGQGGFAAATITRTGRRDAVLQVDSVEYEKADGPAITLAVGFPKPDRARWLVEKATELGVSRVIPLKTEHSGSSGKPLKVQKLRQYVIDACKQSRRNVLMQVDEPTLLETLVENSGGASLLVADVAGSMPDAPPDSGETIVFIGPEAGFSRSELDQLNAAGAKRVRFARNILRVETAAVAAAALLVSQG